MRVSLSRSHKALSEVSVPKCGRIFLSSGYSRRECFRTRLVWFQEFLIVKILFIESRLYTRHSTGKLMCIFIFRLHNNGKVRSIFLNFIEEKSRTQKLSNLPRDVQLEIDGAAEEVQVYPAPELILLTDKKYYQSQRPWGFSVRLEISHIF